MRTTSPYRVGVTLIELLITMTIMAIIAAAILGTAAAAIESARTKRTQTMVNKISGLILELNTSYETRRIPLHRDFLDSINSSFTGENRGRALADCRLLAVRELQKYEMPDRWTDIIDSPLMLSAAPQLALRYRRAFYGNPGAADDASYDNQGAECLYLVVMNATADGEARTLFNADQIGDVDGDGRKEFLDGWGKPISWLRWPTGFPRSPLVSGDAEQDHDPFDPYRRDSRLVNPEDDLPKAGEYLLTGRRKPIASILGPLLPRLRDPNPAFRMMPLIYSTGSDGGQGFTSRGNKFKADLDPYTAEETVLDQGDTKVLPGTLTSDESIDNIYSHLIEY